jgi:hypothetical protein
VPRNVAELARMFGLKPKTMGRHLKRLEEDGFARCITRQSWQVDLNGDIPTHVYRQLVSCADATTKRRQPTNSGQLGPTGDK